MTVQNPSLPGSGIAVRVLRDDGKTYIGAVVPAELYTAGFAANAIRNSAGISASEIARVNAGNPVTAYSPSRPPISEGPGWAVFHGSMVTANIARDDGVSYLSYSVDAGNYNPASVASVLAAIPGLTALEVARARGIGGGVIAGGTPTLTLNALTVSNGSGAVGTAFSATISGLTSGSQTPVLSGAGSAGLSVAGAVITGTPTAVGPVNITETLAGATNSPRTTSGVVTIVAAGSGTGWNDAAIWNDAMAWSDAA